jgi:hypothetical protein
MGGLSVPVRGNNARRLIGRGILVRVLVELQHIYILLDAGRDVSL